jgi:16S rRNA (cytosine967-C5)-methyltransferase
VQALLSEGILPSSAFAVQDESAGMVVAVLDPQPGEAVLDCCAAPGGKALFIAERMGGQVGSHHRIAFDCVFF